MEENFHREVIDRLARIETSQKHYFEETMRRTAALERVVFGAERAGLIELVANVQSSTKKAAAVSSGATGFIMLVIAAVANRLGIVLPG